MNKTAITIAAMFCVAAAVIGHWHVNAGPLEPPSGPVMSTSPSLSDLESKIDALAVASNDSFDSGPWEVFRVPATGQLTSNLSGSLVADGPVYVKSVVVYEADAVIFDGEGQINNLAYPVTDNWLARHSGVLFGVLEGYTQASAVPVEQVCETSLHVAWSAASSGQGFVYVLYRPLEESP